MVCFVYRPRRAGKLSALWCGRYRFDDMPRPVSVPLGTPDEMVARKRLSDLIVRLQRQKEGLAPAEPMREAARKPFAEVVTDYGADLRAQERAAQHVKDTTRRLLRLGRECGWRTVADVTAASFTKWRAEVRGMSAKTRKEYQVSLNAFFRWLVSTERFDRNPLARVTMPETRGKSVRNRRSFTPAEIVRLLAVAEHRRLPYLFLLYTGFRYREAWGVRWRDLHLDTPTPFVLLGDESTKDREKRAVPLHPGLVEELHEHDAGRNRKDSETARVFRGIFPTQKRASGKGSLAIDLEAAGIPKIDASGRVIDFHSFRKTWQTMGVRAGIALRSAQAILGHSTPDLTANAYTDVAALELHREIEKLPWLGGGESPGNDSLSDSLKQPIGRNLAMVDLTGLESGSVTPEKESATEAQDAAEIASIFAKLSPPAKAKVLAYSRRVRRADR